MNEIWNEFKFTVFLFAFCIVAALSAREGFVSLFESLNHILISVICVIAINALAVLIQIRDKKPRIIRGGFLHRVSLNPIYKYIALLLLWTLETATVSGALFSGANERITIIFMILLVLISSGLLIAHRPDELLVKK